MKSRATRISTGLSPSDRISYRLLLCALVLDLVPVTARPAWPATFDVRNDPVFGNATAAITSYARAKHASGTHDFCVLGNVAEDQTKSAWIIWRRMHQIVLWEGQDLTSTPPRRLLNLKKD